MVQPFRRRRRSSGTTRSGSKRKWAPSGLMPRRSPRRHLPVRSDLGEGASQPPPDGAEDRTYTFAESARPPHHVVAVGAGAGCGRLLSVDAERPTPNAQSGRQPSPAVTLQSVAKHSSRSSVRGRCSHARPSRKPTRSSTFHAIATRSQFLGESFRSRRTRAGRLRRSHEAREIGRCLIRTRGLVRATASRESTGDSQDPVEVKAQAGRERSQGGAIRTGRVDSSQDRTR